MHRIAALPLLASSIAAQCAMVTTPTGLPQLAAMLASDRDGPGPLPATVVVADVQWTTTVPAAPFSAVSLYDPTTGSTTPLGPPLPCIVNALAELTDGRIVAAGTRFQLGIQPIGQLGFWNGSSWALLPDFPPYHGVTVMRRMANGDLLVGGTFASIGGVAANGVARFDGTTWHAFGAGPTNSTQGANVLDVLEMPNGDVIAAGTFSLQLGSNLYWEASVKRWNGVAWTEVGNSPFFRVERLARLRTGDVVAVSRIQLQAFGPYEFAARWNGTTWIGMSTGLGSDGPVVTLPNGDLAIGGTMQTGTGPGQSDLGRWNGTAWVPLATNPSIDPALRLVLLPDGSLLASNATSTFRAASTCQPGVASYGTGCVGSAGPTTLAAITRPWAGSAFLARAGGMPASSLVLSIYGFTPLSASLAAALPQALPGCQLLMSPDLLDVLLPNGGEAITAIVLPDLPALAGQSFHHYVVPFEFGPGFVLTTITSSNALTATIGAL